jgi:hypothetical protein
MVGKNGGTWSDRKRYDYYICNNRERTHQCKAKMVRRDIIELQVLEELEKRILNPAAFPAQAKEIHDGMQAMGGESKKEIVYLQAELAKLQVKINNMLELIEEGADGNRPMGMGRQQQPPIDKNALTRLMVVSGVFITVGITIALLFKRRRYSKF